MGIPSIKPYLFPSLKIQATQLQFILLLQKIKIFKNETLKWLPKSIGDETNGKKKIC